MKTAKILICITIITFALGIGAFKNDNAFRLDKHFPASGFSALEIAPEMNATVNNANECISLTPEMSETMRKHHLRDMIEDILYAPINILYSISGKLFKQQ